MKQPEQSHSLKLVWILSVLFLAVTIFASYVVLGSQRVTLSACDAAVGDMHEAIYELRTCIDQQVLINGKLSQQLAKQERESP